VSDKVTDLDLAFGGVRFLPKWGDIPRQFKDDSGDARPWVALFRRIFYRGGEGITLTPKEGVDEKDALRKIMAVARSFEPKHEHKTAGCAYLFSQSFDEWFLDGVSQVPAPSKVMKGAPHGR
jgi:hypothetical protein